MEAAAQVRVSGRARAVALGKQAALGGVVGALCGCASALFLWLLEEATSARGVRPWLVYALPLAGLGIGWFYERFGEPIKGGSDLVIDTLHSGGPRLPLRMAPMVLVGTVLTHLFGGSAGREGTAVQMGASLADDVAHRLRLSAPLRKQALVAGVAGGFGSVFGTPIAGAVFGMEYVVLGRMEYRALLPALVAAVVGDLTTQAWGVGHTHYLSPPQVALTPLLLLKWVAFAAAMAGASVAFVRLTGWLKGLSVRHLKRLPWRMCGGGVAVVVLWWLVGTDAYLGLGVPMIGRAFHDPSLPMYAFAAKLVFTAVTLSAGFLGGEVTPLFFVGATLGSVLAGVMGLPLALGAGVGLAAVFAAAANAPLALSMMAVELLGASALPHVVVVCVLAYLMSGQRGIYGAQRVGVAKGDATAQI
jgi:H+/Cl- antiporter ClcA